MKNVNLCCDLVIPINNTTNIRTLLILREEFVGAALRAKKPERKKELIQSVRNFEQRILELYAQSVYKRSSSNQASVSYHGMVLCHLKQMSIKETQTIVSCLRRKVKKSIKLNGEVRQFELSHILSHVDGHLNELNYCKNSAIISQIEEALVENEILHIEAGEDLELISLIKKQNTSLLAKKKKIQPKVDQVSSVIYAKIMGEASVSLRHVSPDIRAKIIKKIAQRMGEAYSPDQVLMP